VRTAAETQLGLDLPGMTYDQLLPAAQKVLAVPTVGGYYRDRYAAIICDEFQDTNDAEWSFMQAIAPGAQRVLLGDLNQCIYAGMKNIDPTARIAQATAQANAILAKLNPAFELAVEGVIRDLVTHSTPKLNVDGLLEAIRSAHHRLGFPRGEETWNLANQYLRRAARGLASNGSVETLAIEVERTRVDTLVEFMSGRTKRVQVMNLHQTKGDATVLLLQEDSTTEGSESSIRRDHGFSTCA